MNLRRHHLTNVLPHSIILMIHHGNSGRAKKHDKGKALTILAHRLARAVYYLLKRKTAFDMDKFLNG